MTSYKQWCEPVKVVSVGSHTVGLLVSVDDDAGIRAVAAHLPSRYAATEALARIAERFGKAKVSAFLRNKLPPAQGARSGDLGEILASAYLEEDCGYVVGPSRLIQRDHHEWAMRGDDVLGAKFDSASNVLLIKGEAKSRARAAASVVKEARESLQREDGLPSTHSLTQFAERLLSTVDDDLGEAIIKLQLEHGVRPGNVSHLMFLFSGNDPSSHVRADLTTYRGLIAQQAVILRVQAHQDFVRTAFEKAIADGA
ncbi:Hachiman antiphage defense system protein HamA [Saccharopolyspora sp. ASAGF58]|uniref:Hachiman antiphage defense system protein HamA n=1 Tax=Saccharopolyspora sp. ASAGF58 TaxID=2719023 RepID=UPI00143FC560|nr:Hachiman antiphage defense system protein HamA [Saccharopolyspora sp. ASAGF58]QIZ37878.1 DUF1837 domain-containing protein [Saccharopolyspora sp. ASAGF58]